MDTYNFRWTSIINSYIIYSRVIDDFFFWKYLKTEFKPHIYMKRWFHESLNNSNRKVRAIPLSGTNLNAFWSDLNIEIKNVPGMFFKRHLSSGVQQCPLWAPFFQFMELQCAIASKDTKDQKNPSVGIVQQNRVKVILAFPLFDLQQYFF